MRRKSEVGTKGHGVTNVVGYGPSGAATAVHAIAACAVALVLSSTAHAAVTDPLRCWWRSTASAVRIGEKFTVVLTCRVAATTAETAVVERGVLDPVTVQLPPFDVVGGSSAIDLRTDNALFFQYEYTLRLIDDLQFNRDVALPLVALSYRIQTQADGAEAIQGIERTYSLPEQSVHILSLVPDGAADIRDASATTFRQTALRSSRANVLVTCGIGLIFIGGMVELFGVVRLVTVGRRRDGRGPSAALLSHSAVLRRVKRELAAVRRERQQSRWTPVLEGRALVALRILGSVATGGLVHQRRTDGSGSDEGTLLAQRRLRASRVLLSSSITPQTLASLPALRPATAARAPHRMRLQLILSALTAFTRARYGRGAPDNESELDASLEAGERVVQNLMLERRLRLEPLRTMLRTRGEVGAGS